MGIRKKYKSTRFFTAVIGLLISVYGQGQAPVNYSFAHLTTTNGLLNNNIHSIVQDEDGYMWFGTMGGLQRYDGVRFRTFRTNNSDSLSLPSNIVQQLLLDSKKNLWVLFDRGRLGRFDTKKFRFNETPLRPLRKESLKTTVSRLVEDDDGRLFLMLGGNEILMLDSQTNVFIPAGKFLNLPDSMVPADLMPQPGTPYYWIALQNGHLAVYNRQTKKLNTRESHESGLEILDTYNGGTHPYNLFFDSKNRLWFDSWGPGFPFIYCYDLRKKEWVVYEYEFLSELQSYYELRGFFEQSDGTIWVYGSRIFGAFDEQNKKFRNVENGYKNERSLSYDMVLCLYEDAKNNIWLGTESGGVHRFNPGKNYFLNITHINRKSGKGGTGSVMAFMPTRWGTVISGVWHDGLYEYDQYFNEIPLSISGWATKDLPSAWCLAPSVDSNIFWMSAQPGIYKINQRDRKATYFNPHPITNRTIRQILEDRNGSLWVGLQNGGVLKWQAGADRKLLGDTLKRISSVPIDVVNKLYLDSKNRIWAATSQNGLFLIDATTDSLMMHFNVNRTGVEKLPESGVSSVLEYNDSTFLITTGTHILIYRCNEKKLITVHDFRELSVFIAAMEKDRQGYVWISTTGGLFRYNINNDMFVWFRKSDGIDNENFTLSASRVLPDGKLMFGSGDQFVVFDPARIDINNSFPEIRITGIRVHNKSLLVDSLLQLRDIDFGHHNNSMVIEFSSLTYGTAYIDVKYKLEGIDKDWQMADESYQAVYSYLPPGSYTFLVKSENAEGNSGNAVTRLKFTILPPFYRTWWFYSLLILLGVLLLYWFDRERMKRKAAIQQMRSAIADNLHEEVTTTLNNITILSEIARLKADKDLEKSKEYIDQINQKSRKMMYNMEDMLWSISPENDSMEKMLLRMREYAEGYEKEFNLPVDFQMDSKLANIQLDMLKRQELFFIFKDAVNCMVHSFKADKAYISMDLENRHLLLKMRAEKFTEDMPFDTNCIYLKDIRKRVASLNAHMDFLPDHRFVSMILQVNVN